MQQENCTAQLGQWLAGSENGSVYYCQETEVVSLCLHYMTMRFEAKAFRALRKPKFNELKKLWSTPPCKATTGLLRVAPCTDSKKESHHESRCLHEQIDGYFVN